MRKKSGFSSFLVKLGTSPHFMTWIMRSGGLSLSASFGSSPASFASEASADFLALRRMGAYRPGEKLYDGWYLHALSGGRDVRPA